MRKGRSQRKTRGSRPPTSAKSVQPLGSNAPPSGGPQVVIGLTGTRDDGREPRPSELPLVSADAEPAPDTRRVLVPSAPSLRAASRVDHVELPEESPPLPVVDAPEPAPEPARLELTHEEPARIELTHEEPAQASVSAPDSTAESLAPHVTSLTTPDEMSIPPASDLVVDAESERFFSQADLGDASDDEAWEEPVLAKAKRKSEPHVVQRRARFAKYVSWAVGGAAVVCLAALVRTAVSPAAVAAAPRGVAASALEAPPAPAEKAAAPAALAATPPAPAPENANAAEVAKVEVPAVAVPAAPSPEPQAAVAAPEPPKAPAPAPAADGKTALEEKKASKKALERGKLTEAIEAGERAVALDASDGEAWLLLGAAYQEKGKMAEARRAYAACVKEGKRGPIGECRAMLR